MKRPIAYLVIFITTTTVVMGLRMIDKGNQMGWIPLSIGAIVAVAHAAYRRLHNEKIPAQRDG